MEKENITSFKTKSEGKSVKRTYRVTFLTGPALKVLSVGDGKIPTKKVKVRVSHRENMKF